MPPVVSDWPMRGAVHRSRQIKHGCIDACGHGLLGRSCVVAPGGLRASDPDGRCRPFDAPRGAYRRGRPSLGSAVGHSAVCPRCVQNRGEAHLEGSPPQPGGPTIPRPAVGHTWGSAAAPTHQEAFAPSQRQLPCTVAWARGTRQLRAALNKPFARLATPSCSSRSVLVAPEVMDSNESEPSMARSMRGEPSRSRPVSPRSREPQTLDRLEHGLIEVGAGKVDSAIGQNLLARADWTRSWCSRCVL